MEDSLACDNGLLDRFLLSKDQNTWQIIQEWAIIEEKLKKIYFFTEQQISSVFHQNHYRDILSFDQIIDDVELQYKNFPLGISINQYLYETLMSFETPSLETIEENMYRGILNLPEKYIDDANNPNFNPNVRIFNENSEISNIDNKLEVVLIRFLW